MQSNLDSFLDSTTPVVPSHSLPKVEINKLNKLWHPWDKEQVEYFTLADLWDCYEEWSAYGAGVPVFLNNTDPIVQYYAPYLSAIQIFTNTSPIHRDEMGSRDGRAGGDSSTDSRRDGSSPSEEGGSAPLNGLLGSLYFQYFDQSTPYARITLIHKINGFARKYPGIMSLRSVDLSPASWMAVAWYPIYRIPVGRTIKSLSTCFLTYHTLSSSFQDMDSDYEMEADKMEKPKAMNGICVRPFGMATYRLQRSVWASSMNGCLDHQRLVSLSGVADSWLKQLRVKHHDFNHFTGQS